MLYLYHSQGDYCLVNTDTFTPGGWRETATAAISTYFNNYLAPYPEHTCFTYNADYELIATFPALTSLKDFYDQFPEIFI